MDILARSGAFNKGRRNAQGGRCHMLATASLAALVATVSAAGACAQTAAAAPGQTVEEVVITGSRIARRDFVANSPITTVSQTALESNGSVGLESKLATMPQFTAAASSFTTTINNPGQANVNLRGLGTNRVLVLLDGRRLQPSTSALVVDINTIPSALIGNVEVISGGASAVYGSDAISGVVNLKLKRNFDGVQLDAQYGVTAQGDGKTRNISAAGGGEFADGKGSAVFAIEYYDRGIVFNRDRPFYTNGFYHGGSATASNTLPTGTYQPDTANLPTAAALNGVFGKYGVTSSVTPTTIIGFNTDGSLFTDTNGVRNYKGAGPAAGYATTASGTLVYDPNIVAQLVTPLDRYTGFAHADFDVNSHVSLYGQAMFTSYTTYSQTAGPLAVGVGQFALTVPVTNPFIPSDLATVLASRSNKAAPFSVIKRFQQVGDRLFQFDTNLYQVIAGAKGDVPGKDWTWDIYGSHGATSFDQTVRTGGVYLSLVQNLLNAADGGASLCAGGLNVFGDQPISASCKSYIGRSAVNQTNIGQDVVEASFQGSLLSLPAGRLRFAAGADYRRNTYEFVPDSALIPNPPLLLAFNSAAPTRGETKVAEVYGELSIPLLSDLPFVKLLEIDPAYRYSDYNVTGGVSTYKVDFNWTVVSSFRLRGGYERAVRAPNVGELFTGALFPQNNLGSLASGGGDPCDVRSVYRTNSATANQVATLCAAQGVPASALSTFNSNFNQVTGLTSGSTALKPEVADTYTFGGVWRPEFSSPLVRNIQLSVDYWKIELAQAIGTISGNTILYNCFNANQANPTYAATNVYCSNISRAADGTLRLINQPYLNLGGYKIAGVDFQLNWGVQLADMGLGDNSGSLNVDLVASYLDQFLIQNLATTPLLNYKGTIGSGTPYPTWKSDTTVTYRRGDMSVGMKWRYLDAMNDITSVTNPAARQPGTPAYNTFDLFARYRVTPKLELRGGVDNVADKTPYIVGGIFGTTDPNTFDPLGRRAYVAVRAAF